MRGVIGAGGAEGEAGNDGGCIRVTVAEADGLIQFGGLGGGADVL
jgi:hypothetical protein